MLTHILEVPSYGYQRNGALYVPTHREIFREFFRRLNIFKTRKYWLALLCWGSAAVMLIPCYFFLRYHFSWPLLALGFVYSMVVMGTHGTIYYHRYSTHRAYKFRHPFFRFWVRNAVIKMIPEEIYVVSHHVHHSISEEPGDPYNVHAGWLYCFLADVIHQPIATNLSREEYEKVSRMIDHTGVIRNSYEQYQTWGSICHPVWTILTYVLNWGFWYGAFYLLGGHALATAMFTAAGVWAFGVRTFNYDGHGGGKDKRKPGIDFNTKDLSINQIWPGYPTGEWHNNHHLYPNSARAGFLPYQFDGAWEFIRFYHWIGGISWYRDSQEEFLAKYYRPYLAAQAAQKVSEGSVRLA